MYVFCFFRDFAPAVHLAISTDLLQWHELNGQEPILEPEVGGKYWRDPFTIQAQDGIFHLLCTDGWTSPYIAHASSSNLIDWSPQDLLHVMKSFPSAQNAWAPEACYDREGNDYLVFWSSTVLDAFPMHENKTQKYQNHRIYACRTPDFKQFSEAFLYFDPGFNCIDASISHANGQYLMAFKDERGNSEYFTDEIARKHLLIARTSCLNDHWEISTTPISKSNYATSTPNNFENWTEGPSVFWNGAQAEWWVFYEYFRSHKYGAVKSNNGVDWVNMDSALQMPPGVKHGTIFEVNDPQIIKGLERLNIAIDD
jgi:hypothetical protein